jgi:diguanylate cyclase (GGDEF)-like protein
MATTSDGPSETDLNGGDPASTTWKERLPEALNAVGLASIKSRILALALVATLVPALSTAVLSHRQQRIALTENLNGELRSRGSQTAREVDLWVKERSYDIRVFTGSFEVTENLERIAAGGAGAATARTRLTDYLAGVHGRFTDYARLEVLNATAQPIASSGDASAPVRLPTEWLVRLEGGETVIGEPYRAEPSGKMAATLAAPILTPDGRFLGVLGATLDLDAVARILDGLAPGDSGRVDVVTGTGQLVATSAARGPDIDPATLERLAAAEAGATEYVDGEGTPMVGSLSPVPGLTWAVVTQIPTAEAYAQVVQLRNSTLLLVSGLLVAVGLVAYLLGSVIARPLVRLTAGARAVSAGDFSVDLPVTGRGEVGYLTQVFNDMVGRLRQSREELDQRSREFERLSLTDQLTGLYNRRFILEALDREISRAERHEQSFCVVMIDVDRFKAYNDTHGHLAGDQVLQGVGTVIPKATRELDVVARYGGEEFIVLLPECNLENGVKAGERIRARVARETFDGRSVTISVGVAEFPMHADSAKGVIGAADAALYEAKRLGRDRVQAATPESAVETSGARGGANRRGRGETDRAS